VSILKNSDVQRIHGIDERIGVQNYIDAIAFYHQLLQNVQRPVDSGDHHHSEL